jgi:hypothetical protein
VVTLLDVASEERWPSAERDQLDRHLLELEPATSPDAIVV